jgi:hypothetical protein
MDSVDQGFYGEPVFDIRTEQALDAVNVKLHPMTEAAIDREVEDHEAALDMSNELHASDLADVTRLALQHGSIKYI